MKRIRATRWFSEQKKPQRLEVENMNEFDPLALEIGKLINELPEEAKKKVKELFRINTTLTNDMIKQLFDIFYLYAEKDE